MKDTWYGDKRDLVKWGTLVHLARREKVDQIVQVAFLRRGERSPLQTTSGEVEIAEEVWAHFRDVTSVESLGQSTGLTIEVITRPFDKDARKNYVSHAATELRSNRKNKIVLLDPDTGIEPQKAKREHVKMIEVQQIWKVLSTGDWLVLYQHKWIRNKGDWREITRGKFEQACGTAEVEEFESRDIANDVIFFAARK